VILSFLSPTATHPVGGVKVIVEFANAMARRGHTVHLFHHRFPHPDEAYTYATSVDEIDWLDFDSGISHVFVKDDLDLTELPDADIFFGYSAAIDEHQNLGLPVTWVQGYKMLGSAAEDAVFEAPCPKVCVARWLVDVGIDLGVSPEQLVHIPIGIHHDRFATARPIEDRSKRVGFLYNPHPQKGATVVLKALETVRREHPDLEVVAFGAWEPEGRLPDWVNFVHDPSVKVLSEEVLSSCAIFVCGSRVEGFGLSNIEAMACGAALVTTENGGSSDYAFDRETARVVRVDDDVELASSICELLDDEDDRIRLALAGQAQAATFTWDESALRLEDFLVLYRRDPDRYQAQPR
jgi:glycosyltransferase involved in cell wall biosynthesis